MKQTELVIRDGLHSRHRARSTESVVVSGLIVLATLLIGCADSSSTDNRPPNTGPSSSGAAPTTDPGVASSDGESSDGEPGGLPLQAPEGDAFYRPPDPVPGDSPGDLIWARRIASAPPGSAGWEVLYRSESVAGLPIAVSGVVFAPASPTAAELPVVSWAHGTTGLADSCAPSSNYVRGEGFETVLARTANALGWTFVATDYEGLGTPGVHPYLVGQSEGRGVLDIVRAARSLGDAAVGATSPVAILGHSQGGHAALMASELAPIWAPELDVVGTVAIAPVGDVALIESNAPDAGDWLTGGFSLMIDAGFAAAYPDLPIDALVTDDGLDALAAVAETCTDGAFALVAESGEIQRDGTQSPQWAEVYDANSPGNAAPSAPVLILHGDADDIVPAAMSQMVFADYCALGATAERIVYGGADHGSVITLGLVQIQQWISDRFAGQPARSTC